YYLIVSELVAYKRLDLAVRVFSKNGRKLRIVGDGPQFKALRRTATLNIDFCGRLSDEEVREQYARCRAFLMPGEEDFGITAVEALASGKPVIALGRGGALEIVPIADPVGGLFFPEPTDGSLDDAIRRWDRLENDVDSCALQAHAAVFSEPEFVKKIRPLLYPPVG
ncbi:MAG TPA: glycosyltransferase, partial [Bryobacteraceae bacterium]|nr:glycosyltransferase [Bryobacteraceae bacterium]